MLRRTLAWWLMELAAMMPKGLTVSWGGRDSNGTVLQISAEQVVLLAHGGRRADTAMLPVVLDQIPQSKTRIQASLRARRLGDAVVIQLAADAVLEMDIVLPAAAESTLSQVLRHQLERLTPLPANAISFAFRIIARIPSDKTLKVALVVVKKTTLEAALGLARDLGLRPALVTGPSTPQNTPLTLWRVTAGTADPPHRWLRRSLDFLVVVLLVGAFFSHCERLDRLRDRLRVQVATARQEAADVQTLAKKIETQQKLLVALAARQTAISPLRVINELTQVVPLDSWVFQFGMSGGVVDISGYAPRATDLIARMETSPLFEKSKFRTPITLAPDGKAEQFSLTLALHQQAPP